MKTVSELTDIYYKHLYPSLQELEDERKKIKNKLIGIGFFYTLLIGIITLFLLSYDASTEALFGVVFIYIAGMGFLYRWLIKDYTNDFKFKIIAPLIKAIDKNLTYSPSLHLPSHYFVQSKLFTSEPDRITGNDYVQGTIDNVAIKFSDLQVETKHENSKGNEEYTTIFMGLFIVSEFNKNFHGRTVILPDTAQKTFGDYLGHLLQQNNFQRADLVKMDNPAFEKEFVVYGTDQIEARYILTPAFMEKLLILKKRSKHPVSVSFVNKNIHIAIEYNKDLFEPSVFHSLLKYKIAMEYIQTLHLAVGIIEELKLNKKLWSKL